MTSSLTIKASSEAGSSPPVAPSAGAPPAGPGPAARPTAPSIQDLLAEGRTQTALAEARRLVLLRPDRPRPHALLAHCLQLEGDLAGAAREIERAIDLAQAEGNAEDRALLPRWLSRRFAIAEDLGEPGLLRRAVQGVVTEGGDLSPGLLGRMAQAAIRLNLPDEADWLTRRLLDASGQVSGGALRAQALALAPECGGDALVAEAIRLGPGPTGLAILTSLSQVAVGPGGWTGLARRAYDAWAPSPERDRLGAMIAGRAPTRAGGGLAPAKAALRAACGQDPDGMRLLVQLCRDIRDEDLPRPLVDPADDQQVVISEKGPGDLAVVVFTGLQDRTGVPLQVLDAYLAATGATAIYLRDPERLLFLNGVPALAPDLEGTTAALAGRISALDGVRRTWTLGSSAGGLAAVLYARALGAERAVAFAAPTRIEEGFLDRIGDRRGRIVLRRLLTAVPGERLDLPAQVAAWADPPRIDLVYGDAMPQDRAHAEAMAGLPGVTLAPLRDCDTHAVLTTLMRQGLFGRVLDGDLSGLGDPGPMP